MGMFGVHRFYLGQKALGVLYFVMAFIGIGVTAASDGEAPLALLPLAIGMIDAVLFFAMPRPDFDEKYNKTGRQAAYSRDYRRYDEPAYSAPPYAPGYREFKRDGIKHFREFRFEDAADDFEQALALSPEDPTLHFNLACTYSMLKDADSAYYHLEKAVASGFNKLEKIRQHDALAFLRNTPRFEAFVSGGYRQQAAQLPAPEHNILEEDNGKEEPESKAPAVDILSQIAELGKLKELGILTDEEFTKQKKKLLERS